MPHMIKPYIEPVDLVALAKKLAKELPKPETPKQEPQQENKGKGPEQIAIINPDAQITKSDYLQAPGIKGIHGNPIIISKFEIQGANNKNYENTHKHTLQNGLYMPTPGIFMPHFLNIVNAFHKNITIFDGEGNPISRKELEDIYKHLTTNHISVYGVKGQEGAWTWLNGKFIKGTGFNSLDLETVIGLNKDGNLITRSSPLEECVWNNAYVNLKFNSQGLATRESGAQEYKQGNNIYFRHPIENAVVRFTADSSRADLYCDRLPGGSDPSLGVFVCAEGAAS